MESNQILYDLWGVSLPNGSFLSFVQVNQLRTQRTFFEVTKNPRRNIYFISNVIIQK